VTGSQTVLGTDFLKPHHHHSRCSSLGNYSYIPQKSTMSYHDINTAALLLLHAIITVPCLQTPSTSHVCNTNKTRNCVQRSRGGSCNHSYTGGAISVTYCEFVCVCSLRQRTCNEHAPYCHLWPIQLYLFVRLLSALQPPVGQGLLIHEVSRSHTTTYHSR